jgi:hypothetical protein
MEKTNELNKFLSYIHMGTSIFRIYIDNAERLHADSLISLIKEIEEIFKTHEEKITRLIHEENEKATTSLTAAGILGVYKEKLKIFDNAFTICINALKSTNMGLISAIKFLEDNKELHKEIKDIVINVIEDYQAIEKKLVDYIMLRLND